MFERLRELVDRDPSLAHARGGDGKTALHCARTVEIAAYLLDRGADIDARDVDHESTPAQYLVRDAPDVTRLLIERGAWFDIFIAIGLRDADLVERCLREDPEALNHRTGQGKYNVVHNGKRAATPEEIGDHRGNIYNWVFDHNISALEAAERLGHTDTLHLLQRHASPAQRLIAACAKGDRFAAQAIVTAHPGVVATMTPTQSRVIVHRAQANDTAAVELMVELGFDPLARGAEGWGAIRWAAFHGNAAMTRLLLAHNPPINVPDPTYGGTLLDQCLYGAVHGWSCRSGDFAATVRLLLDAGERVDPTTVPTGRDDVDAVLREHLARRR
jgi:ankyrin repeat protein